MKQKRIFTKAFRSDLRMDPVGSVSSDNSYIVKSKAVLGIWMGSILMALLCLSVSYPGIFYSDSYVRVATGKAVWNNIIQTLTGNRQPLKTDNAFTVIPSFIMSLSLGLTGHVALYTFFQAFAFFAAVFLLIRELNPALKRPLYFLFAISPIIYGASVYYEANIGSAIGIIMLILLLRRVPEEKTKKDRILEYMLIAAASFITYGYRTNALTVLPVLIVYLFRTQRNRMMLKKILALSAQLLGIILVWLVPWIFNVQSESNLCTGFVWEMITVIQRMDEEEQASYLDYLDEIGGEGATKAVLQTSNENSVDGFMWGGYLNTEVLSAPGATTKVLQKYFRLIWEKPLNWLQVKGDFTAKALGITRPLDLYEYPYNRWDRMDEYDFNDNIRRELFHQSFHVENSILEFYTCRPWVAFLISIIFVGIERFRKNEKRDLYSLILWLAVFYYMAYLVMIVVFEQRMFYPSLLLLMILDAAILSDWLYSGFLRLWKKRSGRDDDCSHEADQEGSAASSGSLI